MVCTLLAGVNVVAFAADGDLDDTISVQKFYFDATKGGNGEHIYTVDEDEISWYKSLPSWNDEGEAWKAPLFSEDPVYRVANYNTGEHLWITDKGYVDYLVGLGWTQEQGVAFYSDENMGVPVYRLWNGTDGVGSHHFTTNEEEIAWLVSTGWTNEGPQFYGVKEEEPVGEIVALQTGANTIEVTSDTDLSGATDVDLFKGSTEQEQIWVYNDEENVIYITTTTKLTDGEYSVVVSDEEGNVATDDVECETEELDSLYIAPVLALQTGDTTFKNGTTVIKGQNQFGEEFALGSGDMNVIPGIAVVAAGTGFDASTGIYKIRKDGDIPFQKGDQFSITAIYQEGTNVVQATETVTVSDAPVVANIEIGEFTTTNVLLKDKPCTLKYFTQTDSYYFPVVATSQYGTEFTADELNAMVLGKYLFVSPDATGAFGGFEGFEDVDGEVHMKVGNAGAGSLPGTGTISISAVGGFSTITTFTVLDNPYIATMTYNFPSSVYQNTPAYFTVGATDQYGFEYDLYAARITPKDTDGDGKKETLEFDDQNALTKQGSTIKVNNGELGYVKNSATKTVAFTYTPDAAATSDVVTFTTAAPSVTTKTITVAKEGTPASIQSTLGEVTAPFNSLSIVKGSQGGLVDFGSNLVFVDSNGQAIDGITTNVAAPTYYGKEIKAGETLAGGETYVYNIGYDLTTATPAYIQVTAGQIIAAPDTSKDYKVSLYKVTYEDDGTTVKTANLLDSETFKVKVADSNQMVAYTAVLKPGDELLKNVAAANDEAKVFVYGTDAKGVTALLPNDLYLATVDSNLNIAQDAPEAGMSKGYSYTVKAATGSQEAGSGTPATPLKEGTAEVTIWGVLATSGTGVKEIVDTVELSYSNAPSTPVDWSWTMDVPTKHLKDYPANETVDIKTATTATVNDGADYLKGFSISDAAGAITYNFFAVDQYGLEVTDGVELTVNGVEIANGDGTFNIGAAQTTTVQADLNGLETKTIYLVRE